MIAHQEMRIDEVQLGERYLLESSPHQLKAVGWGETAAVSPQQNYLTMTANIYRPPPATSPLGMNTWKTPK